ncbi:MAG: ImmA/IrrE family metallo-endopeptidase [Lachnospiraceae bacterium]|nr:ImmA/IrrE family metallo-endopeptidase [Lachnospiraceae bacterium]
MHERKSREEKMSQIQKKLEDGVREIYSSDKYRQYIRAMSKFPKYSINNCILIVSQCPVASLVCGYHTWQKEFNRTVNKGEHGIMIMAPVKGKAMVEEEQFDENNRLIRDENGKPVTELVQREYQTYRPVYVFDASQTSGDPIPSLVSRLEGDVPSFGTLRDILIKVSPVPISLEEIGGSANGYYSPSDQRIVIDQTLPQQQMIKTMIHEISHAKLRHGSKDDKWDRNTKEVQAESVSYWVLQMLDEAGFSIDSSDYSFGYISGWSKDREVSELKENMEIIKTTAEAIVDSIEESLKEMKNQDINRCDEKDRDQVHSGRSHRR